MIICSFIHVIHANETGKQSLRFWRKIHDVNTSSSSLMLYKLNYVLRSVYSMENVDYNINLVAKM